MAAFGLEAASGRLMDEAREDDDSAVVRMTVVVLKLVVWLRTLNYLLTLVRKTVLSTADRETVSVRVDQFPANPGARNGIARSGVPKAADGFTAV